MTPYTGYAMVAYEGTHPPACVIVDIYICTPLPLSCTAVGSGGSAYMFFYILGDWIGPPMGPPRPHVSGGEQLTSSSSPLSPSTVDG